MSAELFKHINTFVSVNDDEFSEIRSYFTAKTFKKKEAIAEAGSRCLFNHFVVKGCVHMYFIREDGVKQTIQFAIENWWVTDYLAYLHQATSSFYIETIEDTEILSISHDKQEELLRRFPQLERYFRIILQIAYGSSLMKLKFLTELSKEEIYFHFTKHFPQFAQRVPQYLIASFLGLTPEYVSQIRGKNRS